MMIDKDKLQRLIDSSPWDMGQFAVKARMSRSTLYNILSSGEVKKDKYLASFVEVLNIDPSEIVIGEFNSKKIAIPIEASPIGLVDETDVLISKSGMEFRELDNGMVLMTMALVPEFAYASYPHGWRDPEYLVELPKYSIVLPRREQGLFRAFEVRGDSMDDGTKYSISHGDVAVGRLIDTDLWDQKLYINGGTDYIIVTHDGVICKRIVGHDTKEGIINCASRNTNKSEFPDFTIRLTEVYELYKIRKIDRDWNHR